MSSEDGLKDGKELEFRIRLTHGAIIVIQEFPEVHILAACRLPKKILAVSILAQN
jgi:hypothetical protein